MVITIAFLQNFIKFVLLAVYGCRHLSTCKWVIGKGILLKELKNRKQSSKVQPNGQKPVQLPHSYSLKSGSLEIWFRDHEFSGFMALGFEIILNATHWFTASGYLLFWITNSVRFCYKFASISFSSWLKYKLVSFQCNL